MLCLNCHFNNLIVLGWGLQNISFFAFFGTPSKTKSVPLGWNVDAKYKNYYNHPKYCTNWLNGLHLNSQLFHSQLPAPILLLLTQLGWTSPLDTPSQPKMSTRPSKSCLLTIYSLFQSVSLLSRVGGADMEKVESLPPSDLHFQIYT